jgi:gamma-glutamyltranspeptidase / glutathione hydrolase
MSLALSWRNGLMALALAVVLPAVAFAQNATEDLSGFATEDRPPAVARHHMVAASDPLAAEAGLQVLRSGGNAIDAAIAVQAMLTLTEPESSGIGGSAYLVYFDRKSGRVFTYDGRETAPAMADENLFIGDDGKPLPQAAIFTGGRSVGVPGAVRMLELAHKEHGKTPWNELFNAAIDKAANGFAVSRRLADSIRRDRYLPQHAAAKAYFFDTGGAPLAAGTLLRNPGLADTLKAIASKGADAFYSGPIAEDIVRAVRTDPNPSEMTLADLATYNAKERPAVCGLYRTWRVCGMGPSSSGAIGTIATLKMLQRFDLPSTAPLGIDSVHLLAEAGRLAHADRIHYVADPDFVDVPTEALLADDYLSLRSKLIDHNHDIGTVNPGDPIHKRADAGVPVGADAEMAGTADMSIVDDDGNALAMTTSVGLAFGSRILVRGFILTDQLSDFAVRPEIDGIEQINRVEAGKRPRSSMSPTLVFDPQGNFKASAGSVGGNLIVGFVSEVLVAMLDWNMDPQKAAGLPHVVNLNGDTRIEKGTTLEALAGALEARGHKVRSSPLASGTQAILARDGKLLGGADPRREGIAIGD